MGFIDFTKKSDLNTNERWALESITRRLKTSGLKMIDLENWEVHGPHENMNYKVWVGEVQTLDKKPIIGNSYQFYIAVYPRQIFMIDDPSDWWKTSPENLI